ncbi:MAG: hypothetical protein A2162_03795 [Deltaproteobacteria bacterium RBG_13_52_11b]|nr:MAG: hypothetical protein A2162_03795 [Deltaproteobacteria bacterium RBG_13_52_11b]
MMPEALSSPILKGIKRIKIKKRKRVLRNPMSLSWFALCYVKTDVLSIFNAISNPLFFDVI